MLIIFDGVDRTSTDVKHKDYSSYALQLYYQRKTKQSIFKVKLNVSYSETDLTRKLGCPVLCSHF